MPRSVPPVHRLLGPMALLALLTMAVPAKAQGSLESYLQPALDQFAHVMQLPPEAPPVVLERKWRECHGVFIKYNYIFNCSMEGRKVRAQVSGTTCLKKVNESHQELNWKVTLPASHPAR